MPPKTKPIKLSFQQSLDLLNENMQQKNSTFPKIALSDEYFLKTHRTVAENGPHEAWQYFFLLITKLINTSLVIGVREDSELFQGTRFLRLDERINKKGIHQLLEEIVQVLLILEDHLKANSTPFMQEPLMYFELICKMHDLGGDYLRFIQDFLAKVAPLQYQLLNALTHVPCPNTVTEAEALAPIGQALNVLPDYRKEYLLFGFAANCLRQWMDRPLRDFPTLVLIIKNLVKNKLFPSCCEVLEESSAANHLLLIVQGLYAQGELFKANYGLKADYDLYNNRYCQPIDALLESLIDIEFAFFAKISSNVPISSEVLEKLILHLLIALRAPKFSTDLEKQSTFAETFSQILEVGGENWNSAFQRASKLIAPLPTSADLTEARKIPPEILISRPPLSKMPSITEDEDEQEFSQEEKAVPRTIQRSQIPAPILTFARTIALVSSHTELLLSDTTVAKLFRGEMLTNPIHMIALVRGNFEGDLRNARIPLTKDRKKLFVEIDNGYICAIRCLSFTKTRDGTINSIVKSNVYNVSTLLLSLRSSTCGSDFVIFGPEKNLKNLNKGLLSAVDNAHNRYLKDFCLALELAQHRVDFPDLKPDPNLELVLQGTDFTKSFSATRATQIASGLKAAMAPPFDMMKVIESLGKLGFLQVMTEVSYDDIVPWLPLLAKFIDTDADTRALAVALFFTTYRCVHSKHKRDFSGWKFRPIVEELTKHKPEYLQGLLHDLQNNCGLMMLATDPSTMDPRRLDGLFKGQHGYALHRNSIYYVDCLFKAHYICRLGDNSPRIFPHIPNTLSSATPPQLGEIYALTDHNRSSHMIKDPNLLAMIAAMRTQVERQPLPPGPLSESARFIIFPPDLGAANRATVPQNSWQPQT